MRLLNNNYFNYIVSLAGLLIVPVCLSFTGEQIEASAQYKNTVALVNDIPITQVEYDTLVEARKSYLMGQSAVIENGIENLPKEIKQKLLDDLVLTELLAQEASKRGVDKLPGLLAEAAIQYKTLLGQTLIQEEIASMSISEEEIRQRYEAIPLSYKYAVRHIKVQTETEANTILALLNKGGDFVQLADKYSIDAKVNKNGWLGKLRLSQMDAGFASTVQQLEAGQYSQKAVNTGSTWRVILLEGKDVLEKAPYSRARDWMLNEIQQTRVQIMLAELRQQARIEIINLNE